MSLSLVGRACRPRPALVDVRRVDRLAVGRPGHIGRPRAPVAARGVPGTTPRPGIRRFPSHRMARPLLLHLTLTRHLFTTRAHVTIPGRALLLHPDKSKSNGPASSIAGEIGGAAHHREHLAATGAEEPQGQTIPPWGVSRGDDDAFPATGFGRPCSSIRIARVIPWFLSGLGRAG